MGAQIPKQRDIDSLKLIYDRTQQDIEQAQNKTVIAYPTIDGDYITLDGAYPVYNVPAKAYYNAVDLNRLEDWTGYLVRRLAQYGYLARGYIPYGRAWDMYDIPYRAQLDRIRRNIDALRDAFFAIPTWWEIIYNNTMDYQQANALEWDLQQVHDWLASMIAGFDMRQANTLYMIAGGVFNDA